MNKLSTFSDVLEWYVAQLKPGGFDTAKRNLARQGFHTFMPLESVNGKSRGVIVTRNRPMFPGYLFIEQPLAIEPQGWRKINSTLGVSRLISLRKDTPSPLPFGFIEELQSRCDEDGIFKSVSDLAPGDRVEILGGPFAGLTAEIEKLSGKGRVGVLLELLGRSVRTEIKTEFLDVRPISLGRK